MALDLRPLTLGELLDRSFTLYRRHFWLFVGLMALPSVFILMLTVGSELVKRMVRGQGQAFAANPAAIAAVFIGGGLVFLVVFSAYMVAYMVALGATTLAVSEIYAGRTATIAGSYSRMRGQVGRLILVMLLVGLRLMGIFAGSILAVTLIAAVAGLVIGGRAGSVIGGVSFGLGMIAAVIGSLIFSLRYALSVPSLVLEGVTAGESIRRSVALTRGNLGRTVVLVVFATIITYVGLFILQGPFSIAALVVGPDSGLALGLTMMGALSGAAGGAITGPLMIVALAVLYYDIRIRKEGLDLQLMLASLDQDKAALEHVAV